MLQPNCLVLSKDAALTYSIIDIKGPKLLAVQCNQEGVFEYKSGRNHWKVYGSYKYLTICQLFVSFLNFYTKLIMSEMVKLCYVYYLLLKYSK